MQLRTVIAGLLVLLPASLLAQVQGLSFLPSEPADGDSVALVSCYGAGPYVQTIEVSRSESAFLVRFVQDGVDFSPNPPHCAQAELGELSAGTYSVTVVRDPVAFPERQDVLSLVVTGGAPQALPAPLLVPLSPAALLVILCGILFTAWRTAHNYVFKRTAEDMLGSSEPLPLSGGLTRR